MDFKRVEEVYHSSSISTIMYHGKPIWIESLDPTTQTAVITSEEKEMKVPVSYLKEI